MRKGNVYCNGILAGEIIEQSREHYIFRYDDAYFSNSSMPAISLTLQKNNKEYVSPTLFPFFSNLISEGVNRIVQSRILKIDENDDFGLLLATATNDTIGKITVVCPQQK
ncbi:MAG: HipA N-terminal domain-containing protein [Bacteroidales bacterium]|jgi:serine/threonine-protein kinase HipA|nr:HipA N-terminal domain-containing protein [Bacteroidales bacterium]